MDRRVAIDHGMTASDHLTGRAARVIGAVALAAVVAAALIPVLVVVVGSLDPTPGFDIAGGSAWTRIIGSARTWRIMTVTILQALASSLFAILIGTPIAYALARYRFPGRAIIRSLATVPFVLPSVVLGSAFAAIFSERGLLEARGSWWLVVVAHVCFNLAVIVRTVGSAISGIDPSVESAARLLGASRARVFRSVVLPQLRGPIAAAGAIVFLFCLTSFGVIVMLGGGSVTTMEVEIWIRATRQFDLSGAAVLGVVQFVAVVATLVVDVLVVRRAGARTRRGGDTGMGPSSAAERLLVAAAVVVVLALCAAPLAALVWRSFTVPGGLGTDHWRNLGSVLGGTTLDVSPIDAVVNSLVYALVALVAALPIAVVGSRFVAGRRGRSLDAVVLVPLGLSATMIGLGLLMISRWSPLDLRRSFWMIPAAQLLVAVPLMTRVLVPAFRSLDTTMLDAASALGASPVQRFWRVEFGQLVPMVVAAAGLGFVTCVGEFGATVFVARSDRMTVPVMIERLMSRPGGAGYGQAMVLSVVLVVICGGILGLVDRLTALRGRELIPI